MKMKDEDSNWKMKMKLKDEVIAAVDSTSMLENKSSQLFSHAIGKIINVGETPYITY